MDIKTISKIYEPAHPNEAAQLAITNNQPRRMVVKK